MRCPSFDLHRSLRTVLPPRVLSISSFRRIVLRSRNLYSSFSNLSFQLSKHAEANQIAISGATQRVMVPFLLKRVDMQAVVSQTIIQHLQTDGKVPPESLGVLLRASLHQRNFDMALRLVDDFLDAKRASGQLLDAADCRDLLFLFVATGQSEKAESLLSELLRRGTLGSS